MRVHRKLVLLLTRDAVFLRDILAGNSHMVVVVDVPQPVVHHRIDDLRITQAISFSCLREQIRSVGHRFHSARDYDGTVFGLDRLRCEGDCFESGAANFVYSHGTYFGSETTEDRRLPSGILAEPRRDY